jgi:hypothetical protein
MGLPTAVVSMGERTATRVRDESAEGAPAQRVLVIARDFPPCRFVGAQAVAQIARYLPPYGWHPVVLTVRERHIEQRDPDDRRTFPGTIVRTGVLPHPLWFYAKVKTRSRPAGGRTGEDQVSRPPGRIRRWVLSFLQTPDLYTGWIPPATIAGLRAIHRWRITHLFSSAPFWTNHLVGLVLKRLTGLPWTVHLRDPWTQVAPPKPVSALSSRLERWLERRVMTRADFVVCVTERHTRLLRQAFSHLPAEKFITIPNGYDEAEWSGPECRPFRSGPPDRRRFVITYTGSLYMGRSPRPLFRALRRLIDAGDLSRDELRVDLFGFCHMAGGPRISEMAAECGLAECVHVEPPLSRPEALRRMAASDLLLLLQESWSLQVPGKTYEYLRAGRPILALTSDGALADLLQRTGGAWVVEPVDEAGIAAAVREAYVAWKRGHPNPAADPALVAAFDRRLLTGQLAALFDADATAGSLGRARPRIARALTKVRL